MVLGSVASGAQGALAQDLLDRAENATVAYINKLAEVHCTEDVDQVKVRPNGKVETSIKTQYDYFVLLQGNSLELQLAESRLATMKAPQKQPPMLLSNGFSMLLLIFHPYYRASFEFTPEDKEEIGGRVAAKYHFAYIAGMRSPAALALREREYPLDLQGSAWVDADTGQPLRIDAELQHPMTDIGLRELRVHVEYAPATALPGNPVLASVADVDLETPRQHWRNSHVFQNYKLFSTDTTQDPNVKVHATAAATQDGSTQPNSQEKP
jgi:hypothetical protein